MDEKLRGDEGYKDGCWTPIREGLSLVRRQSEVREEGRERSILVNIRERLRCLSQSLPTLVMPVCCHGNTSRASGHEFLGPAIVVTTEIAHKNSLWLYVDV